MAAKDFLFNFKSGQPSLLNVSVPSELITIWNFVTSFFCFLRASPMQSPVVPVFGNVTPVAVSVIFSEGHLISK